MNQEKSSKSLTLRTRIQYIGSESTLQLTFFHGKWLSVIKSNSIPVDQLIASASDPSNNWSTNTDGTWSLLTAASEDVPENNRCHQSKCWKCSAQLMIGSAGRFPGDLCYCSAAGDKDEWSCIDPLFCNPIDAATQILAAFSGQATTRDPAVQIQFNIKW